MWSVKEMLVGFGGTISAINELKAIKGFSVEETVGDSLKIQCGDLTLELFEELSASVLYIGLYWDDVLYNVYDPNADAELTLSLATKKTIYKYRLWPIQKVFYDYLKTFEMANGSSGSFGAAIADAAVSLKAIKEQETPAVAYINNRFGFSLPGILANLSGKTSLFRINSINLPGYMTESHAQDKCLLFRGQSLSVDSQTEQDAVSQCFNGVMWSDFFDLVLFGWNSYMKVTPQVGGFPLVLSLDIAIMPKAFDPSGTPITALWGADIEKEFSGGLINVKLSGQNFTYTAGFGGQKLERTLKVSDPPSVIGFGDGGFYWVKGYSYLNTYNGFAEYEINNHPGWSVYGDLDLYYDSTTTVGDKYAGTILFEGQKTLDKISVNGDVVQLNKLVTDQDGTAKVEGIVL